MLYTLVCYLFCTINFLSLCMSILCRVYPILLISYGIVHKYSTSSVQVLVPCNPGTPRLLPDSDICPDVSTAPFTLCMGHLLMTEREQSSVGAQLLRH
ncbi:uncharacterized protein YALI1_F01324g [Yarrowia lipolytica]|uniref:Uncharacterized protein n=1 Tax=Yarrowia lipolytica TaxID=4952 RepID=A0A1D8NLF6_YARLL|nr:hypothetical protein YALI1_F01324g [Yarrowia lipolytica]